MVLLPYFVVFDDDFHYSFINICYDYFPVSQMFYCLFVYVIIDWTFLKIPVRNGGGVRWVRVCMQWRGVEASAHLRTMEGGGGQIFAIFGAYVLIERPH